MATPRPGRLHLLDALPRPALAGARAARAVRGRAGDCQPAFAKTLASEPELLAVIAEAFRALQSRDLRIVRRPRWMRCWPSWRDIWPGARGSTAIRACRWWHCGHGIICTRTWSRTWARTSWPGQAVSIASACRGRSRPRSASRRMPIWSSCARQGTTAAGQRAATGAGGDDTGFRRPESYGPLVSPRLRPDPGALPQALLESSRPLNRQARSFGHPQPDGADRHVAQPRPDRSHETRPPR